MHLAGSQRTVLRQDAYLKCLKYIISLCVNSELARSGGWFKERADSCWYRAATVAIRVLLLGSDKRKRSIGYAVSRSVDSVYQPSASTPLLVCDNESLSSNRRTVKEAQMLKIKIAVLKTRVKVGYIHSVSFSAQRVRSPKIIWQAMTHWLHLARYSLLPIPSYTDCEDC
jgi:hypothetical protein